MNLIREDIDAILAARPLKVPTETGIKIGDRYYIRAKIGGEMQLTEVVVKRGPYRKGKTSLYVDVFGWGGS